jgi:general stress protein 26
MFPSAAFQPNACSIDSANLNTLSPHERNVDMTAAAEITTAFSKHLRLDRTVMLGLEASAPTTLRPMTAQLDTEMDQGPIWFFASTDSAIVQELTSQDLAIFTFVSKGYEVFGTVHGHMTQTTDRATIDRLWNPWVAAWYDAGKDDPKLALLRFDPASAEIWRDGSSLLSGLKLLFGGDPQAGAKENMAKVSLS